MNVHLKIKTGSTAKFSIPGTSRYGLWGVNRWWIWYKNVAGVCDQNSLVYCETI